MPLFDLALLPTSFIGIAFIGNVGLLIINAVIFFSAVSKSRRVSKRYEQIEDSYAKLVSEANERASSILKAAGAKSEELLNSINVNTETIKEQVKQSFLSVASKHTVNVNKSIEDINQDYKTFLGKLQTDLQSNTDGMVQQVIGNTRDEIGKFLSALKQETMTNQEKFSHEISKEFNQAVEQVKAYRQEQLSLVERSINKIIIKVSRAVLSEVISVTEHERLIIDALDRAKKEEVFEELLNIEIKHEAPEQEPPKQETVTQEAQGEQ